MEKYVYHLLYSICFIIFLIFLHPCSISFANMKTNKKSCLESEDWGKKNSLSFEIWSNTQMETFCLTHYFQSHCNIFLSGSQTSPIIQWIERRRKTRSEHWKSPLCHMVWVRYQTLLGRLKKLSEKWWLQPPCSVSLAPESHLSLDTCRHMLSPWLNDSHPLIFLPCSGY